MWAGRGNQAGAALLTYGVSRGERGGEGSHMAPKYLMTLCKSRQQR